MGRYTTHYPGKGYKPTRANILICLALLVVLPFYVGIPWTAAAMLVVTGMFAMVDVFLPKRKEDDARTRVRMTDDERRTYRSRRRPWMVPVLTIVIGAFLFGWLYLGCEGYDPPPAVMKGVEFDAKLVEKEIVRSRDQLPSHRIHFVPLHPLADERLELWRRVADADRIWFEVSPQRYPHFAVGDRLRVALNAEHARCVWARRVR